MKKEDIMAISVAVANSVAGVVTSAIAELMNAANAAKDEDKEKVEKPKRRGFRRRKTNDYEPEERVVNIREYSQKVWVVYGDCKPLADWFKEFSKEKNMGFCPILAAVPDKPCGWWAKRGFIESGFGGIDGFAKVLTEKGFTVNMLDSVVEVKEAMDKAKGKKDKKSETTKVEETPTGFYPNPSTSTGSCTRASQTSRKAGTCKANGKV